MTGGNQLKSRRNKLRKTLNKTVDVMVTSNSWDTVNIKGILEFREPDKGYFLRNTDAQIYLGHLKHVNPEINYIWMDLSKSGVQSPGNYLEAIR